MNNDNILKGQFFATWLFIIVIIASLTLIYNQILINDGKEPILSDEEANNLNIISRTLALSLFLYFLYTAIITYENSKEKNIEDNLTLINSILATIAGFISFYLATKNDIDFDLDIT